jgi:DNA polymerase-1|tara:strand:+ start:578 stop:1426 length:849 start_codon:yes stop_codon:yes gene_type:complete
MAIEFTSLGNPPTPNGNLLVVDGLNLAFRWKHQKKEFFKVEYLRTIESLAKSYDCGEIVVLGDGGSDYRKAIDPEYKANRKERYADQTEEEKKEFLNFLGEFQKCIDLCKEKGYLTIKYNGVEADDIAAVIALNREAIGVQDIWMVSSDKDWDLLITENISRFSTVTRKETTMGNWDEHYDFHPDMYLTFKCLCGDKGDNVPGVNGIGPKRASTMIADYGDVFDIMSTLPIQSKYKFMQNLNEFGAENLAKNIELMDLSYDPDAQVLGHSKEIIGLVKNYVS